MNLKQRLGCVLAKWGCLWFVTALLSIAPSTFGVTITNEYWIDDNVYGSNAGTISDPFIVTNWSSFDAKMAELTSTTNVVIHLLPGTYTTGGFYPNYYEPWSLRSGSRLLGAGMRATTIKLTNDPGCNAVVVASKCGASHVEVADLTVDANGSTATTCGVTSGVILQGNNSLIQRVRAINCRGRADIEAESFGIQIWPLDTTCTNKNITATGSVIRECIVESVYGDYHSAIGILGGGTIENCAVYFPPSSTFGAAYNCGGAQNLVLTGNYAEGPSTGFYSDTDSSTNFTISHNFFKDCRVGVYMVAVVYNVDNVSLLFNKIELSTTNAGGTGIAFWRAGTNRFSNINIVGNTVRHMFGAAHTNSYGVDLVAVSGAVVRDNVFAANLGVLARDGSTNVSIFNNFDFDGNVYTGANQIEPVNSIQRRTVTANATLLPQDKFIGVQTTSAVTLTLPSAAGRPGKEIIVNGEHVSASITVNRAGSETINGALSSTNFGGFSSRRFISDGSNWFTY